MSLLHLPTDPKRVAEARCWRILNDRARAEVEWLDNRGYADLTVSASVLDPGVLVFQMGGNDPYLVTDPQRLAPFISDAASGFKMFGTLRPCDDCGQLEQHLDDCYAAEWDTTPNLAPTADSSSTGR